MSATLTMLHAAYAGPHAAKRMARDGRVAVKTAEKWWQRLTTPRPDTLLRMARENNALREQMLRALQGDAYAGMVASETRTEGAAQGVVVARAGGEAVSPARRVTK